MFNQRNISRHITQHKLQTTIIKYEPAGMCAEPLLVGCPFQKAGMLGGKNADAPDGSVMPFYPANLEFRWQG